MTVSKRWTGGVAGLVLGLSAVGPAVAQQPQHLTPDPAPVVRPDPAPSSTPARVVAPASRPASPAVTTVRRSVTAATVSTRTGSHRSPARHRATRHVAAHRTRTRAAKPAPAVRSTPIAIAARTLAPARLAVPRSDGGRLVLALAGAGLLAVAAVGGVTLARTARRLRA